MAESSVQLPERILLFDSVSPMESVLTSELNTLGFRVDAACESTQAIRLADARPHDLVLIAENVPPDAAAGLSDRVRSQGADAPPVLRLTSLGAIQTAAGRAALRADDFLVTPYSETELFIRVRTMLDARTERDRLRATVQELQGATKPQGQRLRPIAQDDLTELPNRQYLEDFATRELIRAERYDRVISVVKVDLDNLRNVNDAYGREVRDEVLRQIAGLFKKSVRCVDFTARYDDEGFAIVLPETDKSGATLAAERIRGRLEQLRLSSPEGHPIPGVTASLGVATFPHDAPDLPRLIGVADVRLGLAKTQGCNRVAATP